MSRTRALANQQGLSAQPPGRQFAAGSRRGSASDPCSGIDDE
jgi:hypothetical protein